jgi:hypothetical protein
MKICIVNLGTKEVIISFMLWQLYLWGEEPPELKDRRLGRSQSHSECGNEEKKSEV